MKRVWFGCDQQHKGSTLIFAGTSLRRVKDKVEKLHGRAHTDCPATRLFLSDSETELRERIHRIEKPSVFRRLLELL